MNRLLIACVLLVSLALATSCDYDTVITKQLENIKRVGDNNPKKAMLMLDTIKNDEQTWNTHTRMVCDMLDIRLRDKAYIPATSDIRIKKVVNYFNRHGNNMEKQEACYYAGSVYRDLQNYPQAITFFQRSRDYCIEGNTYDSLMLRNTYSNLAWLYYKVQDYKNSAISSQKEYYLAKQMGILSSRIVQNLGASQLRTGNIVKAKKSFSDAFKLMQKVGNQNDTENTFNLLYHLSKLRMCNLAKKCYSSILYKVMKLDSLPSEYLLNVGEYYYMVDNIDSAIICYKKIIQRNDNLENVYDASKILFNIYSKNGNIKEANYYAQKFVQVSDTLNLGKRQELAATANNLYQYHRDQKREKEISERGEKYKNRALGTLATLLPLTIIAFMLYIHRIRRSTREILAQRHKIDAYSKRNSDLEKEIERQRDALRTKEVFLSDALARLQDVTHQIEQYMDKIREQEKILAEKMEQNRSLMRLMHKAELESSAGDIVNTVRETSKGKHKMTAGEWNMLMQAVDEMYPDFNAALAAKLGRIDKNELHVCYLMLIGLTNPQIINVTALPHSAVWRWTKKFEWITTWKSPDMPSVAEKKV